MSLFSRKPVTPSEDTSAQMKAEAVQEAKQAAQQAVQEVVEEMRSNLRTAAQEVSAEKTALKDVAAQQAAASADESKKVIQQAIQQVVNEMVAETKVSTRSAVEQAAKIVEEKKAAETAAAKLEHAHEAHRPVRPIIRPHAFVVMPFGKKKGGDGSPYDFNAIYNDLIKPTLESAGFEAFRADESTTSGDILTDMFQELLLADLVLADMSIDNANVFYELGIRHAFRKRGIIHIQAGRSYMPFDIFNVRTIPYHITPEGVPDPLTIEKDKQAIARVCRDTWASDPDAIHSPIFNLLTGLVEPERRTLRTPLATGFWREYNEWRNRVTIAKRRQRIGDILLLTEEITNPMIKEEAVGEAGRALQDMHSDTTEIEVLLKNADQAMYAAKNVGRKRFSYFTEDMQKAAQTRMKLTNDLRSALLDKQIWVAYQPIVKLETGEIVKAEALARWLHPKLGLVSPAEFIPIAEHSGLIIDIGEWIFQQATLQVKRWQDIYHSEFQISVNKSPVQIQDKSNRYEPWHLQLQKSGLSGKSIVAEITEGLLLEANANINERLLEFRDAGIQVALDDFGTGYSSLSYLKKFDIDYIKIDQSFVRNLTLDSNDMALSEAIIVMAHKLGMQVIAEGIETEEQRHLLAVAGCDYGQGYLFSKPLPADEFEKLLVKR